MPAMNKVKKNNTITIKVVPKAKHEKIKEELDEQGKKIYKVYVTAAPEGGKANESVVRLLAKTLNVPKSKLEIIRGTTSRDKIIKVLE